MIDYQIYARVATKNLGKANESKEQISLFKLAEVQG